MDQSVSDRPNRKHFLKHVPSINTLHGTPTGRDGYKHYGDRSSPVIVYNHCLLSDGALGTLSSFYSGFRESLVDQSVTKVV